MRNWRWHSLALVAAAVLLFPAAASAHLVTTGLGPVYDGIGHFALSPDDLLPVIALALLAGMRGSLPGRWALFILPAAWMLGGLAGLAVKITPAFPIQSISFLVLGILVASDLKLPATLVVFFAFTLGIAHGFLDGVAMSQAGVGKGILELIGIVSVIFVLLALLAAWVVSLRKDWARIVVRVAGSWIAAMGLLLLGWALHTRQMS